MRLDRASGYRLARQHHETRGVVMRILDRVFDYSQPVEFGRHRRCDRGKGGIVQFRHMRRRARRIRMAQPDHALAFEKQPRLAERLGVAVGRFERARPGRHQRVGDAHEMFGHDRQPAFGQQEVDIRHAPVLAVLDRNHRAARGARFHRVERVFEIEAGQRQRFGRILHRRLMRIRSRRTAESDGAGGIPRRGTAHRIDHGEGGSGEFPHRSAAAKRRTAERQGLFGQHRTCESRRRALERRASHQTNSFLAGN